MAKVTSIADQVEAVQHLLNAKFGVRKKPLPKMLAKTGRRLPRGMRRRADLLVEAARRDGNPKLARQMDRHAVNRAYDDLKQHLEAIDVAKRRKDRLLNVAALLAFYVLVVFAAFVFWLWWAGHV